VQVLEVMIALSGSPNGPWAFHMLWGCGFSMFIMVYPHCQSNVSCIYFSKTPAMQPLAHIGTAWHASMGSRSLVAREGDIG